MAAVGHGLENLIGPHDALYNTPPIGSLLKVSLPASGEGVAEGCVGETPWAEVVSETGWKENVGKTVRAKLANEPIFTAQHGYRHGDVLEFVLQMNIHSLPMWIATGKAAH